jgi:hypothetical protein
MSGVQYARTVTQADTSTDKYPFSNRLKPSPPRAVKVIACWWCNDAGMEPKTGERLSCETGDATPAMKINPTARATFFRRADAGRY